MIRYIDKTIYLLPVCKQPVCCCCWHVLKFKFVNMHMGRGGLWATTTRSPDKTSSDQHWTGKRVWNALYIQRPACSRGPDGKQKRAFALLLGKYQSTINYYVLLYASWHAPLNPILVEILYYSYHRLRGRKKHRAVTSRTSSGFHLPQSSRSRYESTPVTQPTPGSTRTSDPLGSRQETATFVVLACVSCSSRDRAVGSDQINHTGSRGCTRSVPHPQIISRCLGEESRHDPRGRPGRAGHKNSETCCPSTLSPSSIHAQVNVAPHLTHTPQW